MFAQHVTMITPEHYNSVVNKIEFLKCIQQFTKLCINKANRSIICPNRVLALILRRTGVPWSHISCKSRFACPLLFKPSRYFNITVHVEILFGSYIRYMRTIETHCHKERLTRRAGRGIFSCRSAVGTSDVAVAAPENADSQIGRDPVSHFIIIAV